MGTEQIDTVIIGGGQAGLATSYYLTQQGREHLILEQRRIGETWRSKRWDSFTLVTPNWGLQLPGGSYQGDAPDEFLARDEVVAYLERYAQSFGAPLHLGVRVISLDARGEEYLVRTADTAYRAPNVVVATGGYHRPSRPPCSSEIPSHLFQLDATEYRNPEALPHGAVLVVGSGQSGAQLAEELHEHGRLVYLAVGRAGRIPRRYRGKDAAWWAVQMARAPGGKTVDQLPSPQAKFAAKPHLSGKNGGHAINLRRLGRDGVVLLGRLQGANGRTLVFGPDLEENLAKADEAEAKFKQEVDDFIVRLRIDAPIDPVAEVPHYPGHSGPPLSELDVRAAGISTVIWATGYRPDFGWVHLPIFDQDGYPIHRRGVTDYPGLYFLGLPWLHTMLSDLFVGVGEDAAHITSVMEASNRRAPAPALS